MPALRSRSLTLTVFTALLVGATANADTTETLPLSDPMPPTVPMPVGAYTSRGNGVDKTGDCEVALADALGDITRKTALLLAYVDKSLTKVTSAECEINDKNKATVKLKAVGIYGSRSDDGKTITGERALEIVQAFDRNPPPLLDVSRMFTLSEVDGHYYLDVCCTSPSAGIGQNPATRGLFVFWRDVQPQLTRLYASMNAVAEVEGGIYEADDTYAIANGETATEGWRFMFQEEALGAYLAGQITAQTLIDRTQVHYTASTSQKSWMLSRLVVGDTPQ